MNKGEELLNKARCSELRVRGFLEDLEKLHRIMKIAKGSEERAAMLVEKAAKLEQELNAAIDEAVDERRKVFELLSGLEETEREVLYRHFVLCHKWTKISVDLFISERQIFYIRKKALEKLERILEDREKESA